MCEDINSKISCFLFVGS